MIWVRQTDILVYVPSYSRMPVDAFPNPWLAMGKSDKPIKIREGMVHALSDGGKFDLGTRIS